MYRTFHNYTNLLPNILTSVLKFFAQAPFSFNLEPVVHMMWTVSLGRGPGTDAGTSPNSVRP